MAQSFDVEVWLKHQLKIRFNGPEIDVVLDLITSAPDWHDKLHFFHMLHAEHGMKYRRREAWLATQDKATQYRLNDPRTWFAPGADIYAEVPEDFEFLWEGWEVE